MAERPAEAASVARHAATDLRASAAAGTDIGGARRAARERLAALAGSPGGEAWKQAVRVAAAAEASPLAAALAALVDDDPAALRAAVNRVAETPQIEDPRVAAILGASLLLLAERPGAEGAADPSQAEYTDLTMAIASLRTATRSLDDDPGSGLWTRSWWRLAAAYRRRGTADDAEHGRAAGLVALRGADQDAGLAAQFAGWMLAEGRADDAFDALEIAAATRRTAADRPTGQAIEPLLGDALSALLGFAPPALPAPVTPSRTEVAAAVRATGAIALMYLHPTDDSGRTVGVMCLDPATDRLDVVANVPVTDPLECDDPSWPAVAERWIGRGGSAATPPRVLVAGTGDLGKIALPAVRTGADRRLAQDLVVSQVACGAEVIRLAGREARPAAEAVFVVNPRGDRDAEMVNVMHLRRKLYPRSICLGRAPEGVDGAGTRQEMLAHLPRASLLHLACGLGNAGPAALELAGTDVLDAAAIRALAGNTAAGLVILPPSDHGSFVALADALLDAGCTGVVGWLRPVGPSIAVLAQFMLHVRLVRDGLAPAPAVGSVQRWMIDPERALPPYLPPGLQKTVQTTDLTQPSLWAPLTYRGR